MRLLALSWTPLWPPRGGASVRGHRLLSLMPEVDVSLVAPSPLPPGLRGPGLWPSGGLVAPVNLDTLRGFSPSARRATLSTWRTEQPDVVLALGLWAAGMARRIWGRASLVLDLCHVESVTAREVGRSALICRLIRRLEARAVQQVNQVWCVSREDLERLVRSAGGAHDRLRVVPNGVDDVEVLAPPTSDEPFRVLFVGRSSYRPNLEAAMFLVREVQPRLAAGVVVTIVGGARVPSGPGVELVGQSDEIAPHYARAGVVCAPVFAGTGTRLKVLEAAAHGRPLVATARAVEGLGLEAGLHYLEARDAESFSASIRRLRLDPGLASRLGASAREHVRRRFRWERIAAEARRHLAEAVRAET